MLFPKDAESRTPNPNGVSPDSPRDGDCDFAAPFGSSRSEATIAIVLCFLLGLYAPCAAGQVDGSEPSHLEAPSNEALPRRSIRRVQLLKDLSASFEEISRRCGRAVVEIRGRTYTREGSENGGPLLIAQNSSGSGIIMSPDGYILTNAHVVRGSYRLRVNANFRGVADEHQDRDEKTDRALPATVVGIDSETDLAVIKVNRTNLPYLLFDDSDQLKQGQVVLALGNPLGLDNSVSLGVVSAVARQLKADDPLVYIQTDAPINPGNSGGPLVDADGRVVGINAFILTQSGGSEGVGFAIPSNIAREVYGQLKTQGHVHRAQLGLVVQTVNPIMADGLDLEMDHGIIVSDTEPNGPAASAGIKSDDIIIALNGKRIHNAGQLEADVYRQLPGRKIILRIQRGADQLDVAVKTEEQSDALQDLADTLDPLKNTIPELGIVGLDLTKPVLQLMPDLRRPQGVVVAARNGDVSYSGLHLEVGDVIYEINRDVIANVAELREAFKSMKSGDAAVLLVERDGHLVYISLELN